ncbi:MAG: peptide-methionine (S)-S-oxide reductase, partial [Bacteroidetes bacterium]|nr:peptide-methionine (S)-S-oxide reductase [Bacteroidota bacterium]
GTQYRSSIFYHNDEQKEKAEFYLKQIDESGAYPDPIVTTIEELTEFYVAEDYHQDYFKNNSSQPYCTFVIQPKLEKFRKAFSQNLK